MDQNTAKNSPPSKAFANLQALLKDIQNANASFKARSGKLVQDINQGITSAEQTLTKAEPSLKNIERDAIGEIDKAISEFISETERA